LALTRINFYSQISALYLGHLSLNICPSGRTMA